MKKLLLLFGLLYMINTSGSSQNIPPDIIEGMKGSDKDLNRRFAICLLSAIGTFDTAFGTSYKYTLQMVEMAKSDSLALLFRVTAYEQLKKCAQKRNDTRELLLSDSMMLHFVKKMNKPGEYQNRLVMVIIDFLDAEKYAASQKYLRELEELNRQYPDPVKAAMADYLWGIYYSQRLQYSPALSYLRNAMAAFKLLKNEKMQAAAAVNIADVFIEQFQNDSAANYLNAALSYYDQTKDIKSQADVYAKYSKLYATIGNTARAIETAMESKKRLGLLLDYPRYGLTDIHLASLYLINNQKKEALALLEESLVFFNKNNYKPGLIKAKMELGKYYTDQNELYKGATYYKELSRLISSDDELYSRMELNIYWAKNSYMQHKIRQADSLLRSYSKIVSTMDYATRKKQFEVFRSLHPDMSPVSAEQHARILNLDGKRLDPPGNGISISRLAFGDTVVWANPFSLGTRLVDSIRTQISDSVVAVSEARFGTQMVKKKLELSEAVAASTQLRVKLAEAEIKLKNQLLAGGVVLVAIVLLFAVQQLVFRKKVQHLQEIVQHFVKNSHSEINVFPVADNGENTSNASEAPELKARINSFFRLYKRHANVKGAVKELPGAFFAELAKDVTSLFKARASVTYTIDFDDNIILNDSQLEALSHIFIELATNSYKYAFPVYGKGHITLTARKDNRMMQFTYRDNGKGKPENVVSGEGSKMIAGYVHQLNGICRQYNDADGFCLELVIHTRQNLWQKILSMLPIRRGRRNSTIA